MPLVSMLTLRAAALTTVLSLALTAPAAADPAPADDTDARYAAIGSALADGESAARLWWVAWTTGFAALTLGEGTVAIVTHDPGTRADAVVGMSGSALGVGAMLLLTSRSAFAYRGRLARCDASTPEARLARLREAERILDEAADDETGGRSPWAHLGGDAVVLAGSFVLWAGYHRYASGWLNLIGGTISTEAQILTRPTAAIEARRAYRAGRLRPNAPTFTWTLMPTLGGATLTGSF
jgi:hypothetical protein